jgi:hypothetical protein
MKRISSGMTLISKKVFPAVWIVVLVAIIGGGVVEGKGASDPWFFAPPVFMLALGMVVWRVLVFDLADEVFDMGAFLLVRRGSVEDKIYFANVMNINSSFATNPSRITMRLSKPSKFGGTVAFTPAAAPTVNPFAKNPIVEELIQRVYSERQKGAV